MNLGLLKMHINGLAPKCSKRHKIFEVLALFLIIELRTMFTLKCHELNIQKNILNADFKVELKMKCLMRLSTNFYMYKVTF